MSDVNQPSNRQSRLLRWAIRLLVVFSLLANVICIYLLWPADEESAPLAQRFHGGKRTATDKIAIVRIEGTIIEGLIGYPSQQLRDAAQDAKVKAVVLLINSPGGTVTASDQLWKQVKDLREGKWERQTAPKPVVAAMDSIAASGGYYIAVPADKIIAQPTTITGSIGVYAAFLDLHQLAAKHGIDMNIIKKGELKGGSMFHAMKPEERQEWDMLVESCYQRFMQIVKEGRGARLKRGLREEFTLKSANGTDFVRRLADGGIFMAEDAKKLGLIDEIGYLDDAVKEAKSLAGLTEAKVVMYSRPLTLMSMLLGVQERQPDSMIHLQDIPGTTGRLWFLTPGYELAGVRVPAGLLRNLE